MQRPFAFRIFPHRKCAGLVSLWVFCTFSGSEIAQMAVFYGRYSSFSDILVHFQDDKISLNVQSCEKLLHLSIFRRESPVQDTASHGTGRHSMAPDAKKFHAVPNNRTDSRSSMLHPAAPHPASAPADPLQHTQQPHPDSPQISQPEPPRPRRRASEARHSVRHTARHFFKSKAQIRHILTVSHPLQNRKAHDLYRVFNGQSWVFLWCARGNSNPWPSD